MEKESCNVWFQGILIMFLVIVSVTQAGFLIWQDYRFSACKKSLSEKSTRATLVFIVFPKGNQNLLDLNGRIVRCLCIDISCFECRPSPIETNPF